MDLFAVIMYAGAALSFVFNLGLYLFLFLTNRAKLFKHYLVYSSLCFLRIIDAILGYVAYLSLGAEAMARGQAWVRYPGLLISAALIVAVPAFFLSFARVDYGQKSRRLFSGIAVALLLLSPLNFTPVETGILPYVPSIFALVGFLCAMIYSQARLIGAYGTIGERLFRVGVPKIVAYNIVCILAGTADSLYASVQLGAGQYPHGILFQPFLYILWNVATFIWAIKFHATLMESVSPRLVPDPGIMAKYGITEREAETIGLLSVGLANKEIAGRLGISANTVRNHVYSIFRKLEVSGRIELLRKLSR